MGTLAVLALLLAWLLADDHRRVTALESERLEVQARVIDDNVVKQLAGANAALSSVVEDLREVAPLVASSGTDRQLKLLTRAMPGVMVMTVVDEAGKVIASSRSELMGMNFSYRDFFIVTARGADPSVLYVSPPFRSVLGPIVVVVSRALTTASGRFIGTVTATLDPDYFAVILRSVLYAPDMGTQMIHQNSRVFLDIPIRESAPGSAIPIGGDLVHRHIASGERANVLTGAEAANDPERLVAFRNIDRPELRLNRPLVVAVGRDASEIYQAWRGRLLWSALLWLAIAIGSTSVLVTSQRRRQASKAAALELAHLERAATERVELALRGADLGLWDLRLPGGSLVVSGRERELLGYEANEPLPSGNAWRDHVHPDDRQLVDESIIPHLRGEAPNYQCEHRILRRDGTYIWVSTRAMIVERDAKHVPLRIVGTHLDITDRRAADERLRIAAQALESSEEQLRQVADNMPALVSRFDSAQRFCFANRAYGDWLGLDPQTLLGRSLREVYGDERYRRFQEYIEQALAGERVVYERELETRHGSRRVEVTLIPQNDVAKDFSVYALIVDITERHLAEERLRKMAEVDGLTGLPNRVLFQQRLGSAMRSSRPGATTALLFLDVDHFKSINDTLGHDAGDQLLLSCAHRMLHTARPTDTVARLGGDEFTIVLEGLRDESDAASVAAKLVETMREPVILGGGPVVVTVSIGLTLCEPDETDQRALLQRADAALYEAKRRGRNGYFCHSSSARSVTTAGGAGSDEALATAPVANA